MSTPAHHAGTLCRNIQKAFARTLAFTAATSIASLMLAGQSASAAPQAPSAAPRIQSKILESQRTKFAGNVPNLVHFSSDQGRLSPSAPISRMRFVLQGSPAQKAAEAAYLVELQSKSSPNYHKFLTPTQIGKLYGPADSDIAAITAWLQSRGFTVDEVSPARNTIAFSGTAAQVESAFRTTMHSYLAGTDRYYANTADPSIPSALAPVVVGLAHLSTIPLHHAHATSGLGSYDKSAKKLGPVKAAADPRAVRRELTITGNTSDTLYITAADAATIYNTPNSSLNANFSSGATYTGSGVTIGIGGRSNLKAATIASYRNLFIGNASTAPITITLVDDGTGVPVEGADADEGYIDTELSSGLAPGADIHFYASNDLFTAVQKAINDNAVDIFSLSYGQCELNYGTSNNQFVNSIWEQAAVQGIVVTVSTGDSGGAGCDANTDSNGNNVLQAVGGLAVNTLASTPFNIAVGGTDTDGLLSNFGKYANTNSASTNFFRSALGYIPESTWNDSTQVDGLLANNVPYGVTNGNIVGGGGGKSSCAVTNTAGACVSGYPKPFYQRGPGVPGDGVRDLPDVSLMAGNGADAGTWLICTDDTGPSGSITVTADCTNQSDGSFYFLGFGGTSAASPSFAGILALVQESQGGRLGLAAETLYDLYNGSHASAVFHDTTIGNISVPCATGSPDCATNTAGNGYLTGYDTTTGYDLATGLGSVDATQLINFWSTAVGAQAATVAVTPAATSLQVNQSLAVAVTVTGTALVGDASVPPGGTVTLSGAGYTSSAVAIDANGKAAFSIPANSLAVGPDTLTATYSGDATYGPMTGTASVSVLALTPTVIITPASLSFPGTIVGTSAAPQVVTLKNFSIKPVTVSSVTVTGTNVSSFTETNTCASVASLATCAITVTFSPATPGPLVASLSIADNTASTPQTVALSGTGVSTYTLTASPVTISHGSSGTSTITAASSNGYTGTIALTCALTTSPTGASNLPTCTPGAAIAFTTGTTATSTVTIGTTASSAVKGVIARNQHPATGNSNFGRIAGAGSIFIAGLLLFGIPARRRAWQSILSLVLVLGGLGVLSGCGGGGGGGNHNPGTTTGAYTFTVTGTATNQPTQTTTISVTVN